MARRKLSVSMTSGPSGYNRTSTVQQELATPLFNMLHKIAPDLVALGPPIALMDCGCSQAGLTKRLIQKLIADVKDEKMGRRQMDVVLNDTVANDWTTAFEIMEEFVEQEKLEGLLTYCAVGKDFYGRLVPEDSLSCVITSSSLHWMSVMPTGTNVYIRDEPDTKLAEEQMRLATLDWKSFLNNRAIEVKTGGFFMFQVPTEHSTLLNRLNDALKELVAERDLQADFMSKYAIPIFYLSSEERMYIVNEMDQWDILQCETKWYSTPFWSIFVANQDAKQYAKSFVDDFVMGFTKPLIEQWIEEDLIEQTKQSSEQVKPRVKQLVDKAYDKMKLNISQNPVDFRYKSITALLQRK